MAAKKSFEPKLTTGVREEVVTTTVKVPVIKLEINEEQAHILLALTGHCASGAMDGTALWMLYDTLDRHLGAPRYVCRTRKGDPSDINLSLVKN